VKVLTIAPQPFFTPRGTPLSVYYRTLVTAELGFDVDLLTYGQGVDADIPGVRIVRIPRFAWLGNVKVGPSLLKAFLDVWLLLWAVAMMTRNRYDIVHAHEESVFFSRFLRPIFRFKLVYDMHSLLSQQLVNFRFTRSRLLIGLFRRLEDGCLAAADAVITISPALADHAIARVREPRRHFLIENSLFEPLRLREGPEARPARRMPQGSEARPGRGSRGPGARPASGARQGSEDRPARALAHHDAGQPADWLELLEGPRPVILYAGTFESYQGIDLLLEAFALLRAGELAQDPFLLLLGGSPEQVTHYRSRAAELGLIAGRRPRAGGVASPTSSAAPPADPRAPTATPGAESHDACRFAGQVSRELAQRATRAAAVLTSPRIVGSNTPLKIYEQIASGVPLVATRIASHTQVLDEGNCFLVDPDPRSMARGLAAALAGGEDVERRVAGARRLYQERYSPAAYRDKMRRLLALVTS